MKRYAILFAMGAAYIEQPAAAQAPPGYAEAEQGFTAYENGRFQDALSFAERAVLAQPTNRAYWDFRTRAMLAVGSPAQAIAIAEEAEARAGANAALWVEIAYVAQRQRDFGSAYRALTEAIENERSLDAPTRLQARLTLADVAMELQRPAKAVEALRPFAEQRVFEIQSRRAYALSAVGAELQAGEAFGWAAETAPNPTSLATMRRSEALSLLEAGKRPQARKSFDASIVRGDLTASPDIDLAMVAVAVGNDKEALKAFERAAAAGVLAGERALDAGYTAMRLEERSAAIRFFRLALQPSANSGTLTSQQVLQTKREIDGLSRRWGVNGSVAFGTIAAVTSDLNSGASGAQLQAGGEITYGLGRGPNGRSIQAFGRLFTVLAASGDQASGARTTQGWVGLKWRPLELQDLVLEGSRLIKIGEDSQQDWLIRASYSVADKGSYSLEKATWLSTRLFVDAARLIQDERSFLFLDGRVGLSHTLERSTATVLTPFWGGVFLHDSGLDRQKSAVAYGPGMSLRSTLPGARLGVGIPFEAGVQYRFAVREDSRANGLFASLSFLY